MIVNQGLHGGLLRPDASNSATGAHAYGHGIPNGQIVVRSAFRNAGDITNTVSMPDGTGNFTVNPANGLPLSHPDNACLLAEIKVNGNYVVEGVSSDGRDCDICTCDTYVFPCGFDKYNEGARMGGTTTVYWSGSMGVMVAQDILAGEALAFTDAPILDGDGNCLYQAGSLVPAGAGAQDLPANYVAVNDTPAGSRAELRL